MGFFPEPEPEESGTQNAAVPAQPEWQRSPDDELPGIVPAAAVLASTSELAITLRGSRRTRTVRCSGSAGCCGVRTRTRGVGRPAGEARRAAVLGEARFRLRVAARCRALRRSAGRRGGRDLVGQGRRLATGRAHPQHVRTGRRWLRSVPRVHRISLALAASAGRTGAAGLPVGGVRHRRERCRGVGRCDQGCGRERSTDLAVTRGLPLCEAVMRR